MEVEDIDASTSNLCRPFSPAVFLELILCVSLSQYLRSQTAMKFMTQGGVLLPWFLSRCDMYIRGITLVAFFLLEINVSCVLNLSKFSQGFDALSNFEGFYSISRCIILGLLYCHFFEWILDWVVVFVGFSQRHDEGYCYSCISRKFNPGYRHCKRVLENAV